MSKRKLTSSSSNSNKKSATVSLNEQLQEDGYRIIHIARLGNCLFEAIERQLHTNGLRARAVDYIRNHPNEFTNLIGDKDTLTAYLARMSRDRTWGGDGEAQALANELLINIHIYDNNGLNRIIVPRVGEATQDIRILYNNYHFYAIVPINFREPTSTSSSIVYIDQDDVKDTVLSSEEEHAITNAQEEQIERDRKKLQDSGYILKWVSPDGNCLFRSVAEQLKDFSQNDHETLRKKAVTYLKDHREDFLELHRQIDIEEAISDMSKLTNYGGYFEFQVLADYLEVDIQVHGENGYFVASRTKTITKADIINIEVFFHGNHFWAVLRPNFVPIDMPIDIDTIIRDTDLIDDTTATITDECTESDITTLDQFNYNQQNDQLTGISMIMMGVLMLLEGYSH